VRVIHYRKEKDSKINYYSNYSRDVFYIPKVELILYKHKPVLWGGIEYKLAINPDLLDEAVQLMHGRKQSADGDISFSSVKRFKYDDSRLRSIINSKDEASLQQGIEELLKKVE